MTLNKNMEEILRDMKKSEFISYECGKVFNSAYGNVRINTDNSSIELTNLQKTVPFFDIEEEVAGFQCKVANPAIEFNPYCIEPFEVFKIGEVIKDIEIINDAIDVNDGEYKISFDRAIVFRTDKRDIMFSRHIWFSEEIMISKNDDYDAIYPVDEVVDTWSYEGENKVKVIRTTRKL